MKHSPSTPGMRLLFRGNQSWFLPLCVWQFGSPCSQFLSISTSASKSGKLKDSRPASHKGVDQRATAAARTGTRFCKTTDPLGILTMGLSVLPVGHSKCRAQDTSGTKHFLLLLQLGSTRTPPGSSQPQQPLLTLSPASPTQGQLNSDIMT